MARPSRRQDCKHRHAVHLGEAQIEYHGVVGLVVAEIMPFLAVMRTVDDVAGLFERGHDLAVQILVVFNDEQSQRLYP